MSIYNRKSSGCYRDIGTRGRDFFCVTRMGLSNAWVRFLSRSVLLSLSEEAYGRPIRRRITGRTFGGPLSAYKPREITIIYRIQVGAVLKPTPTRVRMRWRHPDEGPWWGGPHTIHGVIAFQFMSLIDLPTPTRYSILGLRY